MAEKVLEKVGEPSQVVVEQLLVDNPMPRCPNITLAREVPQWEVLPDQGLERTIDSFDDDLLKSNRDVSRMGRQLTAPA